MTAFRDERERARRRCCVVGRIVSECIDDPDMRITARRAERLQGATKVTLRIDIVCEFDVSDECDDEQIRVLAPRAYQTLVRYARAHFFDHDKTDPHIEVNHHD